MCDVVFECVKYEVVVIVELDEKVYVNIKCLLRLVFVDMFVDI